MRPHQSLWLLAGVFSNAVAGQAPLREEEPDLLSFVTLPNVRALKYNVEYHDRKRVSPGYWFVSPYEKMDPNPPTLRYQPYQIGPYIYDADGNLVWAGSDIFNNRNIFDFKAVHSIGDKPHLSFILQHSYDGSDGGSGIILGNDYEIRNRLSYPENKGLGAFDIHEFNVLDDGKTALAVAYPVHEVSMADFDRPTEKTHVLSAGFTVLDIDSGKLLYNWESYDKISLTESYRYDAGSGPSGPPGWDYVHANAIDKNDNGDYIMSMRFTNTIYLISGEDGHIIWRLGGKTSDFVQDFTFSRQHDVKFIESNSTYHIISLLNNASDESKNDEELSSALIIGLDTAASPMTAKVLRRYNRPDGGLTRLRGNAQLLPNKNMFVGWSESGYISEFSEDGDLLLNARFASSRLNTYRAYKFEFTGLPNTPPDLVASVAGTTEQDLTTTFYVSWNGATEVAQWRFYARATEQSKPVLVGETPRSDFETMYTSRGYLDWVTVEGVDRNGKTLGTSLVQRSRTPKNWEAAGFKGKLETLAPSDPSALGSLMEEANANTDNTTSSSSLAHAQDAKDALYIADETYSLLQMIAGMLFFILLIALSYVLVFVIYPMFRRRRPQYQQVRGKDMDSEEYIGLRSNPPQ